MAGEVIALGSDVTGWNVGDRVCANFCTEHLHGDLTPANSQSALGGQAHGVLTQYKIFKPYVSSALFASFVSLLNLEDSLLLRSRRICLTRKRRRFRARRLRRIMRSEVRDLSRLGIPSSFLVPEVFPCTFLRVGVVLEV